MLSTQNPSAAPLLRNPPSSVTLASAGGDPAGPPTARTPHTPQPLAAPRMRHRRAERGAAGAGAHAPALPLGAAGDEGGEEVLPPQGALWRAPRRRRAPGAPSPTGTPASSWPRSTGCGSGRASATCGWRWARRRSPCTAWCWRPAAPTSRRSSRVA